jgi:hypothetical protein
VLTRGQPFGHDPDPATDRELSIYFQVWVHEMQAQLARLSTRGRQVIVQNSGHDIPAEAPSEVVTAIEEVVEASRGVGASSLPDHRAYSESRRTAPNKRITPPVRVVTGV